MAALRFESPVPPLTEAWERAIPLLRTTVTGLTTGLRQGRLPTEPGALTGGCRSAHALLAVGEREPALDLCHVLARGVARGTIAPEAATALPVLLARLTAWAGDDGRIQRYAEALARLGELPPLDAGGAAPGLAALPDGMGPSWSGEDSAERSVELIHRVIYGMWGLAPEAEAARLALVPQLPPGWTGSALRGVRIGSTTLDLALRIRSGTFALRLVRLQGPPLRIAATAGGGLVVAGVTVDEQPLGRAAVRFEAHGEHEVVWAIS